VAEQRSTTAADVHGIKAEHVFEKSAIGVGVFAVDDYMRSVDQAVSPSQRISAAFISAQIAPAKHRSSVTTDDLLLCDA
jgi:hypothetical protein